MRPDDVGCRARPRAAAGPDRGEPAGCGRRGPAGPGADPAAPRGAGRRGAAWVPHQMIAGLPCHRGGRESSGNGGRRAVPDGRRGRDGRRDPSDRRGPGGRGQGGQGGRGRGGRGPVDRIARDLRTDRSRGGPVSDGHHPRRRPIGRTGGSSTTGRRAPAPGGVPTCHDPDRRRTMHLPRGGPRPVGHGRGAAGRRRGRHVPAVGRSRVVRSSASGAVRLPAHGAVHHGRQVGRTDHRLAVPRIAAGADRAQGVHSRDGDPARPNPPADRSPPRASSNDEKGQGP